jgi:hypothetical protein
VDRVVSAQSQLLGELTRSARELLVDPNEQQPAVYRLELVRRPAMRGCAS